MAFIAEAAQVKLRLENVRCLCTEQGLTGATYYKFAFNNPNRDLNDVTLRIPVYDWLDASTKGQCGSYTKGQFSADALT
jgi:hypothetical protein